MNLPKWNAAASTSGVDSVPRPSGEVVYEDRALSPSHSFFSALEEKRYTELRPASVYNVP